MILKEVVKDQAKKDFPQNVYDQLLGAISAVFLSWESNRAKVYRKLNQILQNGEQQLMFSLWFLVIWVMIVQQVLSLQEIHQMDVNEVYGEYLINAQGEDVVAGTRTPQYITKKARKDAKVKEASMEEVYAKSFQTT